MMGFIKRFVRPLMFAAHLGGFVAGFILEGIILIVMSLMDGRKVKR